MENAKDDQKEVPVELEKDVVAVWGFVLGLMSIPFSFIGIIPLAAIGLGIWGINRTGKEGTGRWMAITGLVLGVLYMFANGHMYGHF